MRVGKAVVNSVIRICRKHRQESSACLHNSILNGDSVDCSGHKHTYGFAEFESSFDKSVSNFVSSFVKFPVCELSSLGDYSLFVGIINNLIFKKLINAEHLDGIVGLVNL